MVSFYSRPNQQTMKNIIINCIDLEKNATDKFTLGPFSVEIKNLPGEPSNANRIWIGNGQFKLELLPSKGLSVGQTYYYNTPLFWEPPIGLPNPENVNLNADRIHINGKPARGFDYLETFMGGIEFYGMKNWGMPRIEKGTVYPLHGETSNIPVKELDIQYNNQKLTASGKYLYRNYNGTVNPDATTTAPWYDMGTPLYEITQQISISSTGNTITLITVMKNISEKQQSPSCGYHITFYAEDNASLHVPAKTIEARGGGKIPDDYDMWAPAKDSGVREEYGIIFKELNKHFDEGQYYVQSLVQYPDERGIEVVVPDMPYTQSWICSGGRNTTEFTYPNGQPVFAKNWDGIGLEVGSDALDHDGNIDTTSEYKSTIMPGESMALTITITPLDKTEANLLKNKFLQFNKDRIIK